MPRKVQSQLIVTEDTRNRADALALVIPDSRAEVYRRALEGGGLHALESTYGRALSRLDPIAERFKMDRNELAGRLAERRITLAEAEKLDSFPSADNSSAGI